MKIFGEENQVTSYFSHMSPRAVKVCILINPFAQPKVYYSYANESGRKVLLTITLNGQRPSLYNIYYTHPMIRSFNSNL